MTEIRMNQEPAWTWILTAGIMTLCLTGLSLLLFVSVLALTGFLIG